MNVLGTILPDCRRALRKQLPLRAMGPRLVPVLLHTRGKREEALDMPPRPGETPRPPPGNIGDYIRPASL
jgi:hypothetical protein